MLFRLNRNLWKAERRSQVTDSAWPRTFICQSDPFVSLWILGKITNAQGNGTRKPTALSLQPTATVRCESRAEPQLFADIFSLICCCDTSAEFLSKINLREFVIKDTLILTADQNSQSTAETDYKTECHNQNPRETNLANINLNL